MSKIPLMIDAWIREAQEGSQWLEDLESRINHKRLIHSSSLNSARSMLLKLGAKLDRLESLLHNLPTKPILYILPLNSSFLFLDKLIKFCSHFVSCSLLSWATEVDELVIGEERSCWDSNAYLQLIFRTDEDVEYRWKMLKDIQLRTKALVSTISAVPSPNS